MRNQNAVRMLFAAALTLAFAILFIPRATKAQGVSKTAMVGTYSVTLKVLPAESFKGPNAEMTRDGGAQPVFLDAAMHPNHHMVVFVKRDGRPVEDASVEISYRRLAPKMGAWRTLQVVRMHVAGKGPETIHYGNNLRIGTGKFEARVRVNGKGPAIFRFSL